MTRLVPGQQAMAPATQEMLARAWRQGGRRDVYTDFNDLTLRITVGALFGATVDSRQARRVAGAAACRAFDLHVLGCMLQRV